jgi:hypothetical protein
MTNNLLSRFSVKGNYASKHFYKKYEDILKICHLWKIKLFHVCVTNTPTLRLYLSDTPNMGHLTNIFRLPRPTYRGRLLIFRVWGSDFEVERHHLSPFSTASQRYPNFGAV